MSNKSFLTDKGYDFDSFISTKYWSLKTRIEYIQRKILICSIVYYELNSNIMTDNDYNIISQQLSKLMTKTDISIVKSTRYYYVFKDFSSSTGFDLYSNLNKADKQYLYDLSCMLMNRGMNGNCKIVKSKTKRSKKQ